MPTPRTPQDRKTHARKTVQRKPTASEMGEDSGVKLRAASRAAVGRKPPAARTPTVTSQELAQEATATPAERPKGMPDLVPLFALHRRDRAKYLRAMDVFTSGLKSNKELRALEPGTGEEVQAQIAASPTVLKVTADLAEMAADVEDVLTLVAQDPDEFALWARKATDEALLQGFSWYQETSSPGEA